MGPFQWPVWVLLTFVYLIAIFPLAFSDRLSLRHLIGNYGEIENMFWYVFGTFTNSLTFSGQFSWSNSKKSSTRLLIGKKALMINPYLPQPINHFPQPTIYLHQPIYCFSLILLSVVNDLLVKTTDYCSLIIVSYN